MFFKRRSRANSYIEPEPAPRSQSYDDYDSKRPDSSRNSQQQQQQQQQQQPPPPAVSSPTDEKEMYPRPQAPQDAYSRGISNGHNVAATPAMQPAPALSSGKIEPMPDMLAQAFNQAVRPYTERIEQLESQLAEVQSWVEQLEQQRAEVHSWIDKRGLRPGVYPVAVLDCTS